MYPVFFFCLFPLASPPSHLVPIDADGRPKSPPGNSITLEDESEPLDLIYFRARRARCTTSAVRLKSNSTARAPRLGGRHAMPFESRAKESRRRNISCTSLEQKSTAQMRGRA
ncbi:hypothetical protein C8F04DRAFT_1140861 [Mycena alexandri]|uniref:Secreted protein n=1 Tax=Mycena alexandri TaxID=1745969 RepID=A0AAD6S6R9_9AGAR|nr:hypothetical protein C8F04DRAFT_1140861 [Mycena alexandri]